MLLLSYNTINEAEVMPGPAEQFIMKVDDFKQSLGRWYSIFALRVIPFLLFIIPVNVVMGHICIFVCRYLKGVNPRGTILLVSWIVVMMGLLVAAITAPKAATVIELVFGFGYIFFAFRYTLFNNALGYGLIIGMILFVLVKLVFLGFDIMRLIVFAGDKEKNIERDESGRVVRAVNEEVYFTKEDKKPDDDAAPATDDEVYFSALEETLGTPKTDDEVYFSAQEETLGTPKTDDELFFAGKDDSTEENEPLADNDFFFASNSDSADENEPEPSADNDFFFG